MDAAHFVLLPFLGDLYSPATRFIKSWSGRKRFSVLGAINTVSKELGNCQLYERGRGWLDAHGERESSCFVVPSRVMTVRKPKKIRRDIVREALTGR
jgi:hypothetical protein